MKSHIPPCPLLLLDAVELNCCPSWLLTVTVTLHQMVPWRIRHFPAPRITGHRHHFILCHDHSIRRRKLYSSYFSHKEAWEQKISGPSRMGQVSSQSAVRHVLCVPCASIVGFTITGASWVGSIPDTLASLRQKNAQWVSFSSLKIDDFSPEPHRNQ